MRGKLETIVGAMFAGKTSELLKRILWAKHQSKKIIVIKPVIDNRYDQEKIITHNDLSHDCFASRELFLKMAARQVGMILQHDSFVLRVSSDFLNAYFCAG